MNGISLIAAERRAHVEREGWTDHNDDGYLHGELAQAAACYADTAAMQERRPDAVIPPCYWHKDWPFHKSWFKPRQGLLRNLVKAGALIAAAIDRVLRAEGKYIKRPPVVCLCGSTRFWRTFQVESLRFTLQDNIVLSIGAASGTDDDHFGALPKEDYDRVKRSLDELHKRKIEMSDLVYVLNVDGYIGESTRSEIEHAEQLGIPVQYLQ